MAAAPRNRRLDQIGELFSQQFTDRFKVFLVYAILIFATIQTIYPLIWMIFGSLKSDSDPV